MTRRTEQTHAPHALLDPTPLVGVLLIMLCIFMLALPTRTDAALGDNQFWGCIHEHTPIRQLQAHLAADGSVLLQDHHHMDNAQFAYWLGHYRSDGQSLQLLLAVADDAPYQRVVDLLAVAHRHEIDVSLIRQRMLY